jgi:hypothetical protein
MAVTNILFIQHREFFHHIHAKEKHWKLNVNFEKIKI